jgi:Yip1 domain
MADTASSPDTVQSNPPKSFLARVIGVFIEPGETFEDIARNPSWISPLILLILFSMAVVETMLAKIGMGQIVMQSLKASGRAANMDPAQLSQAVQKGAPVGAVVIQIIAAFGVPIFLLIVAGFGLLVLNGFFGQKAKFKEVFSVTCYADMPAILGSIMAIAVMFFEDPSAFNPQSPAPISLGFFLNPLTTSHALMALANSLNFIIIWFLVLMGIGLSRVSRNKVKTGSILMVFFGAWALIVIAKVGIAMLT